MAEAVLEAPRDDGCVRINHRPQEQQDHRQRDEPVLSLDRRPHPGTIGKSPLWGVTVTVSSSWISPDVDSTSTVTSSASRTRYTATAPANLLLITRPRQAAPPRSLESCNAS